MSLPDLQLVVECVLIEASFLLQRQTIMAGHLTAAEPIFFYEQGIIK